MTEFQITKYDPAKRVNGIYTANEWTSFSDIGTDFDGTELSYETYLQTETAYIDSCLEIIEKAQITSLRVEEVECYDENILIPSEVSSSEEIRELIRGCLREHYWFKLTSKDFFIRFGYDYYMYIGCALPKEIVENIVESHGLYCELLLSPYNENNGYFNLIKKLRKRNNTKNKPDNNVMYMPIFMSIGLSVGLAIGAAFGSIPVGMCIGMAIGVCLGTAIDAANNKKTDDSSEDDDEKNGDGE